MVARKVGRSRGDALSLDSFLLQFNFNFDGYLRENKRIECLITLLMIFSLSLSGPGDEQQTAGIITTPLLLASTGMSAETKECKILDHQLRQPSALQLPKLKLWNHDGSLDRVDKTLSEAVILIHPILMFNVDCVCVGTTDLVSAALIVAAFASLLQIIQVRIPGTRFVIGKWLFLNPEMCKIVDFIGLCFSTHSISNMRFSAPGDDAKRKSVEKERKSAMPSDSVSSRVRHFNRRDCIFTWSYFFTHCQMCFDWAWNLSSQVPALISRDCVLCSYSWTAGSGLLSVMGVSFSFLPAGEIPQRAL